MSGSKKTYYWDTCIFLAWIKNETRSPEEMAGIKNLIEKLDGDDIRIVTSVATIMEITRSQLDELQEQQFLKAMKNRNITIHSIDKKVAELSREIRNFYILQNAGIGKLSIGDSIHLATALIYNVDRMYTFDGGTTSRCNNRNLKLIPLSPNVAGHHLIIEAPKHRDIFSSGTSRP